MDNNCHHQMHIVNKRKDLNLTEAVKTPNGLAALAFFIEVTISPSDMQIPHLAHCIMYVLSNRKLRWAVMIPYKIILESKMRSHISTVLKEVKQAGSGWHSSLQYASGDVTRRIPQHTSISPTAIGRCHSSPCHICMTQHRVICITFFHLSDVQCDLHLMCSLLDSQNGPSLLCHIKKNKNKTCIISLHDR